MHTDIVAQSANKKVCTEASKNHNAKNRCETDATPESSDTTEMFFYTNDVWDVGAPLEPSAFKERFDRAMRSMGGSYNKDLITDETVFMVAISDAPHAPAESATDQCTRALETYRRYQSYLGLGENPAIYRLEWEIQVESHSEWWTMPLELSNEILTFWTKGIHQIHFLWDWKDLTKGSYTEDGTPTTLSRFITDFETWTVKNMDNEDTKPFKVCGAIPR